MPKALLHSSESQVALVLFLLLFSFYLLIMSGEQYSLPGITMFQEARQLVGHQTLSFDPPLRWGNDQWQTSIHGIGGTLVYVPALLPWRFVRPDLFASNYFDPQMPYNPKYIVNDLYLYSSWTLPFITALTCVLLFALARQRGLSMRFSAFAVLVCGLASPLTPYAKWDLAQPIMGMCLVGALWLTLRALDGNKDRHWVGAGFFLAFGILTRAELALSLPLFIFLAIIDPKLTLKPEWRKRLIPILILLGIASLGIVGFLISNWLKFGSPFASRYSSGYFDEPTFWVGMSGLLISPGAGILWFFPLVLVALAALWSLLRIKSTWGYTVGGIIFLYWFFYGGLFNDWSGGWSWGPRYLVPFVPLLSYLAIEWLAQQRIAWNWQTISFCVFLVLGFAVAWNGILFNPLQFFSNYFQQHPTDVFLPWHNFVIAHSPLITGWDFQHKIHGYDLFWLHRLKEAKSIFPWLGFVTLALVFLGAAVRLVWLLRMPPGSKFTPTAPMAAESFAL